jgi:hypothetical protein
MKEYLLIWSYKEYSDIETTMEFFNSTNELEHRVNELANKHKSCFNFEYACKIVKEIKIIPVEKVTKWEIVDN